MLPRTLLLALIPLLLALKSTGQELRPAPHRLQFGIFDSAKRSSVGTITDSSVIDLASYGGRALNIFVRVPRSLSGRIASVALDEGRGQRCTDSSPPFTLYQHRTDWRLVGGTYRVRASGYDSSKRVVASGVVRFQVRGKAPGGSSEPADPTTASDPSNDTGAMIAHVLEFAAGRLERSTKAIPPDKYPLSAKEGPWKTTDSGAWTSGFYPGMLWLMYELTGDDRWKTEAERRSTKLEKEKNNASNHDVGFRIFTSFGRAYASTGEKRYKSVVMAAAKALATRYDPKVGLIRSWGKGGEKYTVIIDSMMNLELLFWAAANGGKREWYDMAVSHARKTAKEHFRPDGSTYHVVDYYPDGRPVGENRKRTHQGHAKDSTWSRGQAWALYGYTMTYRETKETLFLETARKASDWFLYHLPGDKVPPWDFDAPDRELKDSSAGAIAASGLLELAQIDPDPARRERYGRGAVDILRALSAPPYLAKGTGSHAILLHGTYNKPKGDFDSALVWGDYYFVEALSRLRAESGRPAQGKRILSIR